MQDWDDDLPTVMAITEVSTSQGCLREGMKREIPKKDFRLGSKDFNVFM